MKLYRAMGWQNTLDGHDSKSELPAFPRLFRRGALPPHPCASRNAPQPPMWSGSAALFWAALPPGFPGGRGYFDCGTLESPSPPFPPEGMVKSIGGSEEG